MRPIVAIVGRPNVGKSTLFNRLCGERIAIVEDTPGVTRDRIYTDVEWLNYKFTLIDTGGMEPATQDVILKQIFTQAEIAIETADVILFLTDAKQGVTDTDKDVAQILRRTKKPVVLAVNKVDDMKKESDIYEFYSLALGEPIAISAGQALGLGDMLDVITGHFPKNAEAEEEDDTIKVAIIGKPNAGKSSLINHILGEERLIVSPVPGTTRDAVDTPYEQGEHKFIFIDTAGIRRKSKIKESIEKYSIVRAVAAIERADVCVLMVDALEGVTEQDAKIAGIAHERGRGIIIAVNKWDMVEKNDKTMSRYLKDIENDLRYLSYAPKVFISALSGQRVQKMIDMVVAVSENHAMRIATGPLNDILIDSLATNPPPSDKGRQLKIYYMTQVAIKPPTFVLFVNDKELLHFSYRRYLENKLRDAFGFLGTPIHFMMRNR